MTTNCADDLGEKVAAWAAGAELELFDALGIPDDECAEFMGLGRHPTVVRTSGPGRFREVADELGITGQRLRWGIKGLRLLFATMSAEIGSEAQRKRIVVCTRLAYRAAALLRDVRKARILDGEQEYRDMTVSFLTTLARSRLWRHWRPPLLTRFLARVDPQQLSAVGDLVALGARTLERFAAWRRRLAVRPAESGPPRPTSARPIAPRRSGSSRAAELPALTNPTRAKPLIRGQPIMGWMSGSPLGVASRSIAGMALSAPLTTSTRSAERSRTPRRSSFPHLTTNDAYGESLAASKAILGVGQDWMRPRHVARVSAAARRALLALLRKFEMLRRWPLLLRSVEEIALAKKGGGARLVGQATAIYRIWAKVRFVDVRKVLEERISRAYLPAALGRGALHAAFDLAFDAEAARAKGKASASTCFGLKQYDEQIEVSEIARGCKKHGLPRAIAALAVHAYMGPRRIRVGNAVSRAVFPQRSILAGAHSHSF